MKFIDWRKKSQETQETVRKQAVIDVVEGGEAPKDVIRILGLTESRLYEWLGKYRSGGLGALDSLPHPGKKPLLSEDQAAWVGEIVCNHVPEDFGYETKLWTREIIAELIEQQFGIALSKSTTGRLLRRLDLSYQKARKRFYQQDPDEVKQWSTEKFPIIQQQAQHNGAIIYFADETGIRSNAQGGYTWGKIGETPVVEETGARFGLNVISAISVEGELRFHIEKDNINSEIFLAYLKQIVRGEPRPVFLIVDSHPAHLGQRVIDYVESTQGQLHLETLPGYSPELNPDELVWNWLKNKKLAKYTFHNLQELYQAVLSKLRSLQQLPEKIIDFFFEEHVRYAI